MHAVFGAYLHLVRTMVPLKKILLVRIYFFEADISSKKKTPGEKVMVASRRFGERLVC
jgi:hypothetical protein